MKLNVTLIDPPGARHTHFLFDLARMIAYGLESLGHDCTLRRNATEEGRLNVLLGIHQLGNADTVDAIIDSGHKYIVYQTEIVRGALPSAGSPLKAGSPLQYGATLNGQALNEGLERLFLPLLRGAVAVWDTDDESMASLKAMGIETRKLSFGFNERLEEVRHRKEKDLDFFFYGSMTPHRKEVLSKLRALGYRMAVIFDDAALFRNDLLSRAEIVLTLRQSEAFAHLPQARLLYLVNNRCLVAGESGKGQEPLEDLFLWSEPEHAIELLRQTRARKDRRELADQFHDRFKLRPMSKCLEPLIEALP